MEQFQDVLVTTLGVGLVNLVVALLIIIIGYIVARLLAGLVRRLLKRTEVDNRFAKRMSDDFGLPHVNPNLVRSDWLEKFELSANYVSEIL